MNWREDSNEQRAADSEVWSNVMKVRNIGTGVFVVVIVLLWLSVFAGIGITIAHFVLKYW